MRLLWVFSLLYFYCFSFSALAQMQEEGETVTTEIEVMGEVQEVTETTVTIEHKTTGDVLDGNTGVVADRYEGDADVDWGGAGSVYSHSSCTDAGSGFPATGTDGRTSACGHARYNSLTTWRQYVDLNSFDIKDGGEVNYEFLFAFPNSMYTNANRTAYVQTKGYNDNALQWETGLVTIDKTTFTQNPHNYNNNTNWVNTVVGSHDFSSQLDKVYIEVGGYGEYYWDEFQYTVTYNHITTAVETWLEIATQQETLNTTLDILDDYSTTNTYDATGPPDDIEAMEEIVNMELDMDMPTDMDAGYSDMPDMDMNTMVDVTTTGEPTEQFEQMFEDLEMEMPMMNMEEVVADVQEMVVEIQQIDEPVAMEESNESTQLEIEPIEADSSIEETPLNTEVSENEGTDTTNMDNSEEPQEVATEESSQVENEPENEVDTVEAQSENENEETETASQESEETEVASEKTEEGSNEKETAEETKEESNEEVAEETTEESEPKVADKQQEETDKKAEKKMAKAKEIMNNFESQYDTVAQITTLALVNALGPNISTYSNQVVQPALEWYKTEEIYTEVVMPDPLGNYFGVRDSLVFEQMIGQQYE